MLPEDQLITLFSWFGQHYDVGIMVDKPGEGLLSAKEQDKYFMLVHGQISLKRGNTTLTPRIGEAIKIPDGEAYTAINTGDTTNIWLYGFKTQPEETPRVYPLNNDNAFHCTLDFFTEHVVPLKNDLNVLAHHHFNGSPEQMLQFFKAVPEGLLSTRQTRRQRRCIIS